MRNYIANLDPILDSFFFDKNVLSESSVLKTNVIENNENYLMKINVPGINKEDIKIELKNGYLSINVTFKKEENDEKYLVKEISEGEYSRSFYLGNSVSMEDISAKLEQGVLLLTINKVNKKEQSSYITIE